MIEYCKFCGKSVHDARTLLNSWCPKHPNGPGLGKRSPPWQKGIRA